MIFNHYARYYDLLYNDKNYAAETDFVARLIEQHAPDATSILDLGCGTGRHSRLFAERGFVVHGVDISREMLTVAGSGSLNSAVTFTCGDIRNVRLGQEFDVTISLFHVMSYQSSNEDLLDACTTAFNHLKPGGVFIFDCWYGPAVLSERPTMRVKRLADSEIEVIRIAEPLMHPRQNAVEVNYQVLIREKDTNIMHEVREVHRLRYLFEPEMCFILKTAGFTVLDCAEWLTGRTPDETSWNVYYVCRR